MASPLISVIVPVYNAEPYLRRCLDSIKAQTFTDFEAILVDDGSTDKSGVICDEYAEKDCRFVVVHQQNAGVAQARITAFKHSKGELITFIDSDDYVAEGYLKHLYDNIGRYKADVSCCQVIQITNDVLKKDIRPEIGYYGHDAIMKMLSEDFLYHNEIKKSGMHLYLCGKIIKRCHISEILMAGIDLWYGEDMVAVLLLMQRINAIYISSEPYYYYVRHEGQATKVYGRQRWEANIQLWKRLIAIDNDKRLEEQMSYRIRYHLIEYITMIFSNASSFKLFKKEWDDVFHYTVVQRYFVNYRYTIHNIPARIQMWTLQHNLPLLFYTFMKLREIIYR